MMEYELQAKLGGKMNTKRFSVNNDKVANKRARDLNEIKDSL